MREIIIIKEENSLKIPKLKEFLEKEKVNYEIYQEKSNPDKDELRKQKLIEGYKRSAKSNQAIFKSLEKSAINDFLKSTKE